MSNPFIVNVADLRRTPGQRRTERVVAPVRWGVELSRTLPDPPLRAELVLEGISGGIMVTGKVGFTALDRCHRCLTEWEEVREIALAELFALDGSTDYPVSGDTIDLEPMLLDAVVLSLPLLQLCRDDCAGLCATCGADLNTEDCPGHDESSGSPFSVLRDLLDQG